MSVGKDSADYTAIIASVLLTIAGFFGIAFAKKTIDAIREQTAATRISAGATEDSVVLQEAAYAQWLVYRSWKTEKLPRSDGSTDLKIEFTIDNPTDYPLTPKHVYLEVRRRLYDIMDRLPLAPKQQRTSTILVKLSDEDLAAMAGTGLVLIWICFIEFESVLKKMVDWPMSGILQVGDGWSNFTPELIHPDKKQDKIFY